MICPLATTQMAFSNKDNCQCLKDECAWYDDGNNRCCLLSLTYAIQRIVSLEEEK